MDQAHRACPAGERLRNIRSRSGFSTRKVADLSRMLAAERGSEEFAMSHSRLTQVENGGSVPSIFKLFTLSAIYGVPMNELLSAYIELPALSRLHYALNGAHTQRSFFDECLNSDQSLRLPIRLNPTVETGETNLLSRMVEEWGDVPVALLEHLNLRKHRYGWIGLSDYTMYPLIRPGSFVQIDECHRVTQPSHYRTEYDRPIYFVELRSGYLCSWCEVSNKSLISIPHPLSPCRARRFAFPSDAEIVGRVTGMIIKFVAPDPPQASGRKTASGGNVDPRH